MPLRRYIFKTLTVVSLLLLLVTLLLWARSYTQRDRAFWAGSQVDDHQMAFEFDSKDGLSLWRIIHIEGFDLANPPRDGWNYYSDMTEIPGSMKPDATFLGFGSKRVDLYWTIPLSSLHKTTTVSIPFWFLALIFAILPAIWFIKWRKRRRLGPNSCGNCGYDLTGNETGECPECGLAPELKATKA